MAVFKLKCSLICGPITRTTENLKADILIFSPLFVIIYTVNIALSYRSQSIHTNMSSAFNSAHGGSRVEVRLHPKCVDRRPEHKHLRGQKILYFKVLNDVPMVAKIAKILKRQNNMIGMSCETVYKKKKELVIVVCLPDCTFEIKLDI